MIRNASPATLVVTSFALAVVGFAAGFATSSAFPISTGAEKPIINPLAWDETAPALPVSYATPAAAQPKCPAWQITDTAMEEVLDEMIRRGWRAPTQGAAVAMLDNTGIGAIDPNAPMPSRNKWTAPTSSDEGSPDTTTEETSEPIEPQPAETPGDQRPPS